MASRPQNLGWGSPGEDVRTEASKPQQLTHLCFSERCKCGWTSSPRSWGLLAPLSTSCPGNLRRKCGCACQGSLLRCGHRCSWHWVWACFPLLGTLGLPSRASQFSMIEGLEGNPSPLALSPSPRLPWLQVRATLHHLGNCPGGPEVHHLKQ